MEQLYKQILVVITATLASVSDGMQFAWCSPSIPKMLEPDSPIAISESDGAWLNTIYMLGGFAGMPITIVVADRLGRKKSILLASLSYIVAWALIVAADRVAYLYVARFLAGMGGNMSFVCLPMYVGEVAAKESRGLLSTFLPTMVLLGIIVEYSIGPFLPIRTTAIVGLIIPVVQVCSFFMLAPESPYFLVNKGRHHDAHAALQRLRAGSHNVDRELEEIQDALARQKSNGQQGGVLDIVRMSSNRKALLVIMFLQIAHHFAAANVMVMNLHAILADVQGSISNNTIAIAFAVTMLISSLVNSAMIDRFGRKMLLTSSSIATGICLLLLALYFNLLSSDVLDSTDGWSWIPAACVIAYAVAFRIGLGVMPLVVTAEIFANNVKAIGILLGDVFYIIFGTIAINVHYALSSRGSMFAPLYLFALCCFVSAAVGAIFLPETKGKTLDEIQIMLEGRQVASVNAASNVKLGPLLQANGVPDQRS